MTLVKKQHYVPQFYLRQFTSNGEQLSVYDKFQQKAFRSNIRDVASSSYFYDLSLETIAEFEQVIRQKQADENIDQAFIDKALEYVKDVQLIEKYLSNLETRFARVVTEVIEGLEKRRRFKDKYRTELALMVAVQLFRTQETRESMMELEEKMEEGVMRIVEKMNVVNSTNFTAHDVGIAFNPEATAARHKMMLFDKGFLERTAQILNNHIWVIGVNETDNPFFTSDHPVAKRPNKTNDWRSNAGIASQGIEISMPITPKYNLIMYERSYFQHIEYRDQHLSYLKKDNVTYYNAEQVYSSYRQVFSSRNNFELVEKMLTKHPDLTMPRSRWDTSTLDK